MEKLSEIQQRALDVTGLSFNRVSTKGWIYGRCPFCGHDSKFGMKLNHRRDRYKNHISFNCFRGSCREKGSEYKLFKHFGILHLLGDKPLIVGEDSLGALEHSSVEIDTSTETRDLPVGWRRVDSDEYLLSRKWESWQFRYYIVGRVNGLLNYKLKDYVIFSITEDGENKGYVGRSTWTNQQIESYNEEVKSHNKTCESHLRKIPHSKYKNEGGVYFDRLLFGIDEIVVGTTKTVILVEGPLSKTNVDRILRLDQDEDVKCLCTFGKKISKIQIEKIRERQIENILLLYDPDAIDESKYYAFELQKAFEVKVGFHPTLDPGDMEYSDIEQVMVEARTPLHFYSNMVKGSVVL